MSKTLRRTPRLEFGLKAIRTQRKLTLKVVSDISGLTISSLSDLETGRHSMPTDITLVALCDALEVTPGDLLMVKNSPENN